MSTIGQRLREERERLGLTQIDFAAVGGAKKHSQINYEADRTAPDTDYLAALKALGVDLVYLLTGNRMSAIEAAVRTERALHTNIRSHEEFVPIPVHEAVLAAGGGIDNQGEDLIGHLAFQSSWLADMGISASTAILARAEGDSMAPTIQCGDMLLIDRAKATAPQLPRAPKDTRPAPIYAILDDGAARVKRVEMVPGGTLALLSDNPAFAPEFRPADAVAIIGKVMWWGHTNRD